MRRQSRELALQVLFQREFAPQIDLKEFISLLDEPVDKDTFNYAQQLIDGISLHKEEIDQLIQSASRHWKMDRMSVIDRTILRIGTLEIRFLKMQPKVAIDEAVEIAKRYGNTESSAFVNGLLDQINKGS